MLTQLGVMDMRNLRASAAAVALVLFSFPSNAQPADTIWLSCAGGEVGGQAAKFSHTYMIDWQEQKVFAYEDEVLYNLSWSTTAFNNPIATRGLHKRGYNMQFSPDN